MMNLLKKNKKKKEDPISVKFYKKLFNPSLGWLRWVKKNLTLQN